jgi:hypothetical protein
MPLPAGVNQHSADAVALAGSITAAMSDTALDSQPETTTQRAARAGWFTPAFAKANLNAGTLPGPPGAQWNSWTAHRAYLRVTGILGSDDHPPDTATTAARQVIVTLTPIGRDGWRGAPITQVEAVRLNLLAGAWRIDDVQQI